MLCISDALASRSEAFIKDADDNLIVSSESIKLLGFHFSHRPTVGLHVEKLRQRFRQRAWILMHLQHAVFSQEELSNVYRVMVRPVADYLSAVYHGMLTDQQDEGLERLQSQALKIIFGKDMIHADMRVRAGVTTLRLRRGEACDKLTQKCLTYREIFTLVPKKGGWPCHSGAASEKFAQCDRLANSPLYFMRR